ncbi:MAG: hypothetical protein QOF89_2791 [Acidobacteriota bacterium]|jgi:PKD repeat protein|nr:hypothetical protein [Acidobacteriota bacterium]
MSYPSRPGTTILSLFSCVLVLVCLLSSPTRTWAKGCAEGSPAVPVPSSLWGELQPESILLDATQWTGSQLPNTRFPISTSVDIENGWIFHSFYGGFSIWDARTDPANPQRVSLMGGFEGAIPNWPKLTEFTQIAFYVDAPEGNDNIMALAAATPVGLSIWDTTNKTSPRFLYQDTGKFLYQVYAARINGRDYAFAGDFLGDPGLHVYDMTAAKTFSAGCYENRSLGENNCPGVYVGRIGAREGAKYVHGMAVGNRHFVVKGGGYQSGSGIQIWEVTNPQQPQLIVQDFRGGVIDVHGVALWAQNGHQYLAARHGGEGKIFDVTTCLASGCSSLPAPLWTKTLKPYPESLYWLSATFSRSGTTPFIYFGNHDTCRQGEPGLQTEYLYDVTNPANPRDITPQTQIQDQGETVDYWSWYYSDFTRGFSHFGPRVAKFNGPYLYRAGATIFDVHKWTGGVAAPPVANFTWSPDTVYMGDPVTFTSTSSGAPTSFSWTFQDGNPAAATVNPAQVTFATPGAKSVSLTATNGTGPSPVATKSLTVLNPAPAVAGVAASPGSALVCQPVTLTANGVTGKAPLAVNWTVSNGSGQVAAGATNPFTWDTTGRSAGSYTVNVTVSKAGYPNAVSGTTVTLNPLPALPADGSFAPTNDAFAAATVQFHVAATGATEWKWDFGDGTPQVWSSDPATGPNPLHSYTTTGNKTVKVWVKNCAQGGPNGIGSTTLPVNITVIAPLKIDLFQAQGCQVFCDFSPSQAITFDAVTEGGPTSYEYDWKGDGFGGPNGADDQTSTTPVTSHTYPALGLYTPALRLHRGAEVSEPWIHVAINIRTPTTPPPPPPPGNPSVSVSGPSSGQIGQPYSFSAAGSNCTPGGTWTWNAGSGGTVTGNGATVSITWSSAGSKTVQAGSGDCGTGSASINVTDPSTGGMTAAFTFSPASPQPNQAVSFDASSSTGSPLVVLWEFGDGATAFGTTATHAFGAGTYTVKLTISKDCVSGVCGSQASTTKTVVVATSGGGNPPPPPPDPGAKFAVSPPSPGAGEVATFDATTAASSIAAGAIVGWDFGDGSGPGFGAVVTHAFAKAGPYNVVLSIAPPGCASVDCLVLGVKSVTIGPPPPVSAEFSTDVTCENQLGLEQCHAETRKPVTLTAGAADATYAWSFGDNATGSGRQVSHNWAQPGSYIVTLTVTKGQASATKTRTFVVAGAPAPTTKAVLLPWVSQSRGPLVQSNDLYIYNPGSVPLAIILEFRKRGTVEDNPPRIPATIAPGETLYAPDVLRGVFNLENLAGFIKVEVGADSVEPVITSFDSRGEKAGRLFGQTIGGTSLSSTGSASSSGPSSTSQYLIGLNDNPQRQASFGVSNPTDEPATYRLKFFDKTGRFIVESADQAISRFGQRQFQVQEIRDLFGINNIEDYRVQVDTVAGQVFSFGSDVRLATGDPSFTEPGPFKTAKVYLLGVLNGPVQPKTAWQTDLLLSNVGDQAAQTSFKFTSLTAKNSPAKVGQITLQPGQTERLENVLFTTWGLRGGTGVLTLTSTSPNGVFPIALGESYDNTNPQKRFGQTIVALSDADAAEATKKEVLVGLRQNASNKTTFWVFNPSAAAGEYDIVYRGLNGAVLGTIRGVKVAAGQVREIAPSQHPFKKAGVPSGFTVEIVVKSGKALAAARVVTTATSDPAYIQGVAR